MSSSSVSSLVAARWPATAFAGATAAPVGTFSNPVALGADPWVVLHEGFYYSCASENFEIAVYRSAHLFERGERIVVWRAPACGPHSREIWAPELHRLDGRWYIYVAVSNGRNATHRMIALESLGEEPTSEFRFKAELYTGDHIATAERSRWAIDGTILEHGGRRYMLWSGWEDTRDEQWLYIATMANPWTISSNRVRLCRNDDFLWERVDERLSGRGLNEAPQVLTRNGRIFVVFSASASWQTSYKLGLLELAPGGGPMNPGAWSKRPEPVFAPTNETWGVGHCSFTRSPDGSEDWIVFHAKLERKPNWKRAIHVQRFGWDEDGAPVFGTPIAAGTPVAKPGAREVHISIADDVEMAALAAAQEACEMPVENVALGRAAILAAMGERSIVEGVSVRHVEKP